MPTLGDALGGSRPSTPTTPATIFGQELGFDVPEAAQPIFDVARGFNQRLAELTVGLTAGPVDVIDRSLKQVGIKLMDDPAVDVTQALIEAFEAVGIDPDPVQNLSTRMGQAAFESLVSLGGILKAAPGLVVAGAEANPNLAKRIGATFSELVLKTPGSTLAVTEAGATAGGVIGEEKLGPTGALVGATLGGLGTGGIASTIRIAGKSIPVVTGAAVGAAAGAPLGTTTAVAGAAIGISAARKGTRAAGAGIRRLLGKEPPIAERPLLEAAAPGVGREAAREGLDAALRNTEQEIVSILGKLPIQTGEKASVRFTKAIKNALKKARAMEKSVWTKGFLKTEVDPSPLLKVARQMLREGDIDSPAFPTTEVRRALRKFTTRTVREDGVGIRTPKIVTADVIKNFRSDLLDAMRRMPTGAKTPRRLRKNLSTLAEGALSAMEQAGKEEVTEARRVSTRINDLFFKGAVGKTRAPTVVPEKTTATLLRQPAGFRQIPEIAEEFGAAGLPAASRAAVRAEFADAARRSGTDAAKFLERNKSAINTYSDEVASLSGIADELVDAQKRLVELQRGSLSKFVGQDPQVGIQRLFAATDPERAAAEVIKGITDPVAREGFRMEFLSELFRRSGNSAVKLQNLVNEDKIGRLIKAIISPEQSKRLENILKVAVQVEKGEIKVRGVRRPMLGSLLQLAGRFLGAGVGRQVAGVMGTGATIQQTGATASFGKTIISRMTGRILPEEVFALAITDPKIEALLLEKVPLTASRMKKMAFTMRAAISSLAGAAQAVTPAPAEPPPTGLTIGDIRQPSPTVPLPPLGALRRTPSPAPAQAIGPAVRPGNGDPLPDGITKEDRGISYIVRNGQWWPQSL